MCKPTLYFITCAILSAAAQQNFQSDPTSLAVDSVQRLFANDELQCLPRLLCEQLTGGKPGQLRGLQIDTSSLFTLLKYLGLEESKSPMAKVGEAILTGISNRGDQYSCYTKYPHCPRDQVRLLHYLNNHRGGFFRGFSNPYYGKSESRIVNKNLEYLQQLGFHTNSLPSLQNDYNFQKDQNNNIFPPQKQHLNQYDNIFPPQKQQLNYYDNVFPTQKQQFNQNDNDLIFPNRRPKNFNFYPADPTDRLPSKFQFPTQNIENDFFSNRGNGFFPQ